MQWFIRRFGLLAAILALSSPLAGAAEPDNPSAAAASRSKAASAAKYAGAARFLEQATFGPTAADIAHVEKVGFNKWFNEQKSAPISQFPDPPSGTNLLYATQVFMVNAVNGPDQLRQRMAFTLGQIWVVSGLKLEVVALEPYLRILQSDALGNYRTVMQDVTLSPSMGVYLDMVDSAKASPILNTRPNENYAREFLQLFTIGTVMLNMDGSAQLDGSGNPIPTYDETTIQTMARVFTGWTFAAAPGQPAKPFNPPYFDAPMVPVEFIHDTDAKTLFGQTLPAGQTAEQDLQQALDIVFEHPNVPPFVALRLIQHFVTSNPSPAYVQRIAQKFANNGHGVRGDLNAVIEAVLLDPEARAGDKALAQQPPTGGHLREPTLFATGVLRALGATVDSSNVLLFFLNNMGQLLLAPPSVFNYYSPFYHVPESPLAGPEFQLLTPSTAVQRANFIDSLLRPGNLGPGTTVDLSRFVNDATDSGKLMTDVDLAFTRGQMPAGMKTTIQNAVNASNDPVTRAQTAIYLTASSALYQVEH
jgi:uncharacterized protein (DUF1800 family)